MSSGPTRNFGHPLLLAVFGGILCSAPLLEWLGLGLVSFVLLHRWKVGLVVGLGAAGAVALTNWLILDWRLSVWLLLLSAPVLLLFVRTHSWQLLLLLTGALALVSTRLLPLAGFDIAWSPSGVPWLPENFSPVTLLSSYLVLVTVLAALVGRWMYSEVTAPGAAWRELSILQMGLGSWIFWSALLLLAERMGGSQTLAVAGAPLLLPALLSVWGLPLVGRKRRLLQGLYLLTCICAWGSMVLGFSAWAGMLVVLPLLLDAIIDWRGRLLFRGLPSSAGPSQV